jgi:hypothetical protein
MITEGQEFQVGRCEYHELGDGQDFEGGDGGRTGIKG